MYLLRLNVNQLSGFQCVAYAVHLNIYFPFQNEEIFLHDIVIVRLEILSGLKLHQSKIGAGPFHQIFGTAVSETVFFFALINNKHFLILLMLYLVLRVRGYLRLRV